MNKDRAADDADPRPPAPGSAPPAARVSTAFLPSKHGFPFANCFPSGTPVFEVPTPLGRVPIGDASGGLCGGMVFAALDCFLFGVPPPDEPTPPVFRYLARRLVESWNLPFGVLKYYDWQRRPGASRLLAGVRVLAGVSSLTIEEEWPRIRAALDSGLPAPLGLVNVYSFSPRDLPRNHQVLAHGYDLDETAGELTLWVYDPNFPDDDTAALRLSLLDPDRERPVVHSCEGPTVRGFFLTEYRRPEQAPTFL